MSGDLLQTKLYVPRLRPSLIPRPRLIETLNHGLTGKLTLISAPAGFGKTTLISSWIDSLQTERAAPSPARIAWLSLDENDSELSRFLSYVIVALQRIDPQMGESALPLLQASPLPLSRVLTILLNDIAKQPASLMLVLDDYHAIDSQPIDEAVTFLLEHLPPQLHLAITSREDPNLPLARLRVRGVLTELRAADLRFTVAETAVFLQKVMGLNLTKGQIAALEARTEGWIAGLQMAALSMRGQDDLSGFIQSFTGSHRFVLDYLLEEVLHQQPEHVQEFLLKTAVLNRLTGSLCDALTGDDDGQEMLESLERANLFLVPLDNERRWYRYHHLFADLLRQRLLQQGDKVVNGLHGRASQWYEDNGLELEAFHHAASAHDTERAQRLMEGAGVPLHFRGGVMPVLNWLGSLETAELDDRPALWVMYASALASIERNSTIEQKLQAAEAAIAAATDQQDLAPDDVTRNLIGHIAALRGSLAVGQHQVATIITQAHRALEYLHPDNLAVRTAVAWQLGVAYQLQGDRYAASQAYSEAIAASRTSGNHLFDLVATIGLGQVQEAETQLHLAADSYRHILQTVGESPLPASCDAYLGLARIHYEWNDLDAAQQDAERSLDLAQQTEEVDTPVASELFLAQLKLAQGDAAGAAALLMPVEQFVHQHNFERRISEVAALQILILLRQDNLAAAADLAQIYDLPLSQARVHLAQDNPAAALALLEPLRQQAQDNRWQKERLQVLVLQALVLKAQGERDTAVHLLNEALALAEPGGFIRIFVDEGLPMAQLLSETAVRGIMPNYCGKLLAVFEAKGQKIEHEPDPSPAQSLIDPLTNRELEILTLIAAGLKNKEIAEQLIVSLNTVLYHIKNIYSKLGVNKRTLAIAKAKEHNLI